MPSSESSEDWADRFLEDLHGQESGSVHSAPSHETDPDDDERLGRLAVERGLIGREGLEDCMRELEASRTRGKRIPLGEILVKRRILTTESLIGLLSQPSRASGEAPEIPRYEFRDRLGEGATAIVFRAWDRELKRLVAIKVLREFASMNPIARERFRREAQASATLSHPNVVRVYDLGEVAGRFYIVLELIEGRPLVEVLKEGASQDTLLKLLGQAARGIAAAHLQGIVHRDLKPANILVSQTGEAKVTDFGLAHLVESSLELTRQGSTLGTPMYMSPEQVRGDAREITPRTDVYALGAILYEILSGVPPHVGETLAEIYESILHKDTIPPKPKDASLSGDLETVVMKALDKFPAHRYPTAGEFAEDLGRAMEGRPIFAQPESRVRRIWRRTSKSRPLVGPLFLALLLGLGAGILAMRRQRHVLMTVESVLGEVRMPSIAGRPSAEKGSTLAVGEVVETGPSPSRAVFRLPRGGRLEAGPGTSIRAQSEASFTLVSGTLVAEPDGRPLDMLTPHARIHSSGESLTLSVDSDWTRVESKSGGTRVTRLRDGRNAELPPASTLRVTPEAGDFEPAPLTERILRVGQGRPFLLPSAAAAAAKDGDVVEIDSGLYEGDFAHWRAHHLTIRGIGGRARIKGEGKPTRSKALWVVSGRDALIENIEFSSSASAGLWIEAPSPTVRDCAFLDNTRGLVANDDPESDLIIEQSEFARNGNGMSSNLVCPDVRNLVLRHCYLHHPRQGHEITSLARSNYILYCRISDEKSPSSMVLHIPRGGTSFLIGNLILRGVTGQSQASMVAFAVDDSAPRGMLYFVNNTVCDERQTDGFIWLGAQARAQITNNIFSGAAPVVRGGEATSFNNLVGRDPLFVNSAAYDYHLREGSPAIDAGVDPGMVGAFDLHPRFQYLHPAGKELRPVRGALDLGAFEFGK